MNPPPAWAAFFDVPRWNRFLATVQADFQARGIPCSIDGEAGCVRLGEGRVLGLSNIAQTCFQAAEDRWAYLVHYHFGVALAPPQDESEAIARDFTKARPILKLRLWHREALPALPLVAWDIADDLVAVLTYDLPQMLATVRRDDAEKWPVSKADLWHLGLRNVRNDGMLQAPSIDVGSGATVHVLEGDSTYFAATHLLFLEAYTGAAPEGALVAVPRRHTVVFHVVRDSKAVGAINSMLEVVPRMCFEGPGSITPSLYWWRPGQALMQLPAEYRADGVVNFTPPAAFVDVLNRLR